MALTGGNKRVLMIGGEGVVLYTCTGRGASRETSIAWDVPNFDEQLTDILSGQNAGKTVLILFDGADQAYRKEESIPKLSPFDRPGFVKRKLELAFPSYPIRASLEIKPAREKKGFALGSAPTLPSYLFVALPETDQLDRIGKALLESGVPVSGFGLLPVESATLVTTLAQKTFRGGAGTSRWNILIGQHETGGLRQIVTKDGNLALARLTPTSEAGTSGAGWVDEVVRGYRETLSYISRFGFTPDEGLDVIVICGEVEKQFFTPAQLMANNFRCLTASEALGLIGARPFGFDKNNFSDSLHAAWAGKKTALKLPVRVPSIHRIMAPRLGAKLGTLALLVTALGLAAYTARDYQAYLSLSGELAIKQNQMQMLEREYEEESSAFEALPVKPETIRTTLAIKSVLEANTPHPGPLFSRLKKTLGNDIVLDSLEYTHTPGSALVLNVDTRSLDLAAMDDPETAGSGTMRLVFTFSLPDTMQLEQKVTRAEELQKQLLAAFPGWTVEIATQFGGVDRGGDFQGGTGNLEAEMPASMDFAEFIMEGAPL